MLNHAIDNLTTAQEDAYLTTGLVAFTRRDARQRRCHLGVLDLAKGSEVMCQHYPREGDRDLANRFNALCVKLAGKRPVWSSWGVESLIWRAVQYTPCDVGARMPYDAKVEQQIQSQQENIMAIQRAATESRRAEQQALTAEQQGRANATTEKWKQEAIKAQAVTEAQQKLDVARLDAQAADQERLANERRGAGEAARRRLVMNADGALSIKIDAWLKAQQVWATAVQAYQGNWVPGIIMGGQTQTGGAATTLIDLLTAKTAQDLGLNLGMQKKGGQP